MSFRANRDRRWWILLVLWLSFGACGGGSGGGSDATAGFVGAWAFDTGSVTPMCGAITVPAVPLNGDSATITKVDATHIALGFSSSEIMCSITFAVDGARATAAPDQRCTLSVMGTSVAVNIDSWTMTLAAGGPTIAMSMSGSAAVAIISCTPSGTGTLVRSGTPDAATSS